MSSNSKRYIFSQKQFDNAGLMQSFCTEFFQLIFHKTGGKHFIFTLLTLLYSWRENTFSNRKKSWELTRRVSFGACISHFCLNCHQASFLPCNWYLKQYESDNIPLCNMLCFLNEFYNWQLKWYSFMNILLWAFIII